MANTSGTNGSNLALLITIPSAVVFIFFAVISLWYYFCKKKKGTTSSPFLKYQSIGPRWPGRDEHDAPIDEKQSTEPGGFINDPEINNMNHIMQALASSNKLIKEYGDLVRRCHKYRECRRLVMFFKLLKDINCNGSEEKSSQINTDSLKKVMKDFDIKGDTKQDPFHTFSLLISAIQKDIKDILENENIAVPPVIKMLHTSNEVSLTNKIKDHLAVEMRLSGDFKKRPGVNINELFDSFFGSSKTEGTSCVTRTYFFGKAPTIMLLYIDARESEAGKENIQQYFIDYHETIKYAYNVQLKRDGSELNIVDAEYQLTAIIGRLKEGIFNTYRKHLDQWFLTIDERVEISSFKNVMNPYIMVYEKLLP